MWRPKLKKSLTPERTFTSHTPKHKKEIEQSLFQAIFSSNVNKFPGAVNDRSSRRHNRSGLRPSIITHRTRLSYDAYAVIKKAHSQVESTKKRAA